MGFYDEETGKEWLDNIKSLLIDYWTASNTEDRTPEIKLITEEGLPRQIRPDNRISYVLLYEVSSDVSKAGIYYSGEKRYMKIALDIRAFSRARALLLMNEVERIMKLKRRVPTNIDGDSIGINSIEWLGWEDLSNRQYQTQWWVEHIGCDKAYHAITN